MVDITVFEFNFGEGTEFNPRSTVWLPSALADTIDPDDGATGDGADAEAGSSFDSESESDSSDGASTLVLLGLLAAVVVVALVGRRLMSDDLGELEELDDLDDLGA